MTKVMVFGTFDYLHEGHKNFFKQAKKYGDKLVVVIARDETIKKIKGNLPDHDEETRMMRVAEYEIVDKAMLGNIDDKYKVIELEKPDVLCFGYDQKSFNVNIEKELEKRKIKCKLIKLKSFHPEKFKSSLFSMFNIF